MAKIIRPAQWVETEHHELSFRYVNLSGCGFRFPCDKNGNVDVEKLPPEARQNFEKCLTNFHEHPVVQEGAVSWTDRYKIPAVLRCACDRELELSDPMTNGCECGRFYNGAGQELCHPRLWGEETGERFDDRGYPVL